MVTGFSFPCERCNGCMYRLLKIDALMGIRDNYPVGAPNCDYDNCLIDSSSIRTFINDIRLNKISKEEEEKWLMK